MTKKEAIDLFEDNFTVLNTHGHYTEEEENEALNMAIEALKKESAEPTGYWIEHYNPEAEVCMQHMSECSVCGKMICGRYNIYKNFCPNCGEKMEEQKIFVSSNPVLCKNPSQSK